jgi:UMF1 family MFS transporter
VQPSPTRAERFAWCLFDFANSPYNTIVVTFVYARYFAYELVGDPQRGDTYWAWGLTVSGLAVALLSPILGALADRSAGKRRCLIGFSLLTSACTALLFFIEPASGGARLAGGVLAAWLLFVIANIAFEVTFVFYNAFLPGLGDDATVGRLSGYGWALGYVGGLLALALCLGFTGVGGREPWLPAEGGLNVRATNLLVAIWLLLFALPTFVLVRDRAVRARGAWRGSLHEVASTVRGLAGHPDLLRLLIARLFYNDAVLALIGLASLYMETTIGMSSTEILATAIGLNVLAGLGALAFGFVDDRFGAKTAIVASLALLLGGAVLAIAVPSRGAFLIAAAFVGLGLGPNQSASRSLMARFVPVERSAELYGLFAFSGKATVWIAPLLYGLVIDAGGSQRVALLPLVAMLAIGLALIRSVDERRGMARAQRAEAGDAP